MRAASSSVNSSLPASSAGFSSGVNVQYSQTPCRSGSPHGVAGTAPAAPPCPASGVTASARRTAASPGDPIDASLI